METDLLLVSCDWGTSSFRLRLLRGTRGRALPCVASELSDRERGITSFAPRDSEGFSAYLRAQIEPLFRAAHLAAVPAPVWLSGMITSSLGWKQMPYARLPFKLDGSAAIVAADSLESPCGTHELSFVSGVRTDDDVIRGEECELLGLFALPDFAQYAESAVVVIPGTHSKCIEVRGGCVTGFRTFLTGELFDVLSRHSILKHSVSAADADVGDYAAAFAEGVRRAASDGLLASLFSVRARGLLDGVDPGLNRAYLSGLLIGGEVSAVKDRTPASAPIVLCGATSLAGLYARAFEALGLGARLHLPPGEIAPFAASVGHWRLHCLRGAREPGEVSPGFDFTRGAR